MNSSTKKIDQMTPALMFHRISEGFYEFGTKKIQLQIKFKFLGLKIRTNFVGQMFAPQRLSLDDITLHTHTIGGQHDEESATRHGEGK